MTDLNGKQAFDSYRPIMEGYQPVARAQRFASQPTTNAPSAPSEPPPPPRGGSAVRKPASKT